MMFKNSFKLLMANFSTVWKLLLYYVIVLGITIGLIAPFFDVILAEFNESGLLLNFGELVATFNVSVNVGAFLTELYAVLISIIEIALALFTTQTFVAIYLTVVIFYIMPLLFGLADLPAGQTLFGYMSSLTKYSFTGSYIRMFGRSIRFQLFKNLVYLPVNVGIIAVFISSLKLTTFGGLWIYFVPFIVIGAIAILTAFKRTLFSGWMPAKVVYDCNMFVALGKGMKAVFRRFFRTFSTALIIMILVIAVNYLFGTFAFVVIIPISMMFLYVFEMIMFYGSQGMRYYVDLDTIISPKLLEENDSFKKVKNII